MGKMLLFITCLALLRASIIHQVTGMSKTPIGESSIEIDNRDATDGGFDTSSALTTKKDYKTGSRIYHGTNVDSEFEFPSFVTIAGISEKDIKRELGHLCGGVLIDFDLILTAAHCVDTAHNLVVANSIWHFKQWPERGIISHPVAKTCSSWNYSNKTHINDFALLRLEMPIMNAQLAELASEPVGLGQQVVQVGLGYDENFVSSPDRLQKMEAFNVACGPLNQHISKICFASRGDSATCYGDSGSPAYLGDQRTVVGLLSYGTTDCGPFSRYEDSYSKLGRSDYDSVPIDVLTNVFALKGQIHQQALECTL